jgi:hypothetical protein
MPTGYKYTLSEPGSNFSGLQWLVDPGSPNEARCDQRENDFSGFCGRTDTLTHYGNEAPVDWFVICFAPSREAAF